ncbi:MAG: FliH/SctL family protein [bacterium]
MIWSDSLTPFTQSLVGATASPTPWALEELDADGGEIFRTTAGDVVPTAEELAAVKQSAREHATAEGFAAGYTVGRADAEAELGQRLRSAIDALDAATALVHENETRYLGVLEENLAAIAVSVARQIIERDVRMAPEITVALVKRALEEFPVGEPLRVRINPLDLSAMTLARHGDEDETSSRREVAWMPDARVPAGGCVVEGRERILDGRVDTALERAFRRLANMVA